MREPHLRTSTPGKTLRITWADRGEEAELSFVLEDLRRALAAERLHNAGPVTDSIVPSTRMTMHG
ncbi:MAG: hypothetical protein JJE42_15315, partial [Burkholderiales bacterium]|nr:hypothetical protein [Burkholderiales bacterium]